MADEPGGLVHLVSVIIPTFNRIQYLEGAVLSVLRQEFDRFEVIVVDDGSTDGSRALIERLKGSASGRLRYLYRKNGGAAAARNTGIRAARYETLCFLDSDDRFLPGKLARQYEELHQSSWKISHTREVWYRRGGLLAQKKKHQPPHGDIFQASLRMCVVGMSTVMVRRAVFAEYGFFDESLPCCEDYEFWLRIAVRERFLLVPEPLTLKNGGRPDQLSVRYRRGMDRLRIRALVRLLSDGRLTAGQYDAALAELKRKCRIYGEGCIKHGRPEEGQEILAIPGRFAGPGQA